MTIKANARIHLAVDVGRKKSNGYHVVDEVVLPIDLHDVIEIKPLPGNSTMYLTVDDPTIVCDETNLAYKVFTAMRQSFSLNQGYRIQIYKRIPTEAGLGGGLADAAGVIKALCLAYKIPVDDPQVIKVARSVSPEVPFSLKNIPAHIAGTGEIIKPLDGKVNLNYGVLIVKPTQGLDAKDVYATYDQLDPLTREHPDIPRLLTALKNNDEEAMSKAMANGLLLPALKLCPAIGDILSKMATSGLRLYSLSGSGSACYGLSKNLKVLKKLAKHFESAGYEIAISSTKLSR